MNESNQNNQNNDATGKTTAHQGAYCIYCKSNIPTEAKVCNSCSRYQQWYLNHLDHLGLIAAILLVILGYLQFNEAKKDRIAADDALTQAEKALKLSDNLMEKNSIADQKLKEINDTLQRASKTLLELNQTSEFNTTVIKGQNNERIAFDKLSKWANDESFPLKSHAKNAWIAIVDQHCSSSHHPPQLKGTSDAMNAMKLKTIEELVQDYDSAPPHIRPAIVNYIWDRTDIPEMDRLEFLVDVIKHDKNLNAVEYAGRALKIAIKIEKYICPLELDVLINRWNAFKDTNM